MGTLLVITTFLTLFCTMHTVHADAEADIPIPDLESSSPDLESSSPDLKNSEAESQSVLDLLNEGEEKLVTGYYKDAVLVLGNTGSGKSTLTQFITGNDLNMTSYETEEGTGDYVIRDTSGRISNGSATMSWTIYPEAMLDRKSGTIFFDCPGFSDTRSVAHDIAATYFTKKTIENIGRVKLLFTVGYSAVRIGQDRNDFMELAEHAVTMVKNLDKLQDSIALVVTKVENHKSGGKTVSDAKIIQSVAGYLTKAKSELQRKIQSTSMSTERKQLLAAVIRFIGVLLQKDGNTYSRLGIFRKPDDVGPLQSVHSLRESKKPLEKIIHQNIAFTAHEVKDFGYTISSNSKTVIHELVETIKDNMASDVSRLKREMEELFLSCEKTASDVQGLKNTFQRAYEALSGTCQNVTRPQDFVKRLIRNTRILNITLSQGPITNIEKQSRYLEFFLNFGAREILPLEYAQDFPSLLEYLSSTENYYKVLVYLSNALTNCDLTIADNIERVVSFAKIPYDQSDFSRKERKRIVELMFASISLPQKDQDILQTEYTKIRDIEFNEPKLKKLEQIWNAVELTKMDLFCDLTGRRVTMQSSCLRLSNFINSLDSLCPRAKFIEIFALEKVFIDSDLKLTGREAQVSIIAPVLEVVGAREIVLNGLDGNRTYSQQKAGRTKELVNQTGQEKNGADGADGSPAGSFLGIAERIINGRLLHIFSIGGTGGPGQDGGDGGPGAAGTTPEWGMISKSDNLVSDSHCWDDTGFWATIGTKTFDVHCSVSGFNCIDGGDGGDGGAGGMGGRSGQVVLIGNGQDGISGTVLNGEPGRAGTGGHGGTAGPRGKLRIFRVYEWILGVRPKIETRGQSDLKDCSAGENGSSVLSKAPLSPAEENKLSPGITVDRYKEFLRGNLNSSLISTNLSKFLGETLEGDKAVKDLYGYSLRP
ncbi:uncharacterized protein [Bemisia tabaci]|uniref:uncharacterized protein n=1 Tax=Bemisia tabaci TaxID=7038 RepID=UPI003B27E829